MTCLYNKLLWPVRGTSGLITLHFGFTDCHCSDYQIHKHSFSVLVSPLTHRVVVSSINLPLFLCPFFSNPFQVFDTLDDTGSGLRVKDVTLVEIALINFNPAGKRNWKDQ